MPRRWASAFATSRTSSGRCASCAACCGPGGRLAILEITQPRGPLKPFFSLWFDRDRAAARQAAAGREGVHVPARQRPPLPRRGGAGRRDRGVRASRTSSSACSAARSSPSTRRPRAMTTTARDGRTARRVSRDYLEASSRQRSARTSRPPRPRRRVGAEALAAGGKRLRPLLAFLSAPAGAAPPLAAGVAVELVHMATLVHDDLIDGARVRRGRAAAWTAHGADAARAAGDYLFARAFAELAETGRRAQRGRARRRLARARARRGAAAAPASRPRHDGRGLSRALRAQDRQAVRGRLPARRRRAVSYGRLARRSRSRSPTTSSTARATRSRPARSRAPTSATGRPRCRFCSRRRTTRSSAPRSPAARSKACSCGSRRPARSSAPGRWPSTTLEGRGRASTAEPRATSSRPSPTPSSTATS